MTTLEWLGKRRRILIVMGLAAFAAGAGVNIYQHMPIYHGPHGYTAAVGKVLGATSVEVISHADCLDVMRVDGNPFYRAANVDPATDVDRCILLKSRRYDAGFELSNAKQLVLDRASYGGLVAGCAIEPGLVLRFWQGTKYVDALVCFHCQQIAIVRPERTDDYGCDGSIIPNWEAWRTFALRAYPNDPQFRSLPFHSPHASRYH